MKRPSLSVALVTRNRPASLRRTLASLRLQDTQPWEVVVSDDSDDDLARHIEAIALRSECRYVRGPRKGLYANRNHAAVATTGTHIRTMDDDHEFPPGHLSHCLRAIEQHPEDVWIIGELLPDALVPRAVDCPGQLHPRGFSVVPPDPERCWSLADGASIFPRAIFDSGERYAEFFVFGASYLEFGSRLHWRGRRIRQLRETYVIHHYDASARSFLDPRIDLASRVFAMLSHSFIYQPTAANRLLTVAQLMRTAAGGGKPAIQAIGSGFRSYWQHRATLRTGTS
jgi:glycosyltransferase involved in cell wall biosynthesis